MTLASQPALAPEMIQFLATVRQENPFLGIMSGVGGDLTDVREIHRPQFERLTSLALDACRAHTGLGVVLWGDAGLGKSHVLSRLNDWARHEASALLIYVHNLQAAPSEMGRTILRAVVEALAPESTEGGIAATPFFHLVRDVLRLAASPTTGRLSSFEARRLFYAYLASHRHGGSRDVGLSERPAEAAAFGFFKALMVQQGPEHRRYREAALRWFQGETIEREDAEWLGLSSGQVRLEDDQQIKAALVGLMRLASCLNRPFILCFDQVDNLETEQIKALVRFQHALLDSSPNLLLVTSGVKETLDNWIANRVIQSSTADRLAQYKVELQRIQPPQARLVILRRLEAFRRRFEDVKGIHDATFHDELFPLGREWFDKHVGNLAEMRPRDVIFKARASWEQLQQCIREGGTEWQHLWKRSLGERKNGETQVKLTDNYITSWRVRWQGERREAGAKMPANEDLARLLTRLLVPWQNQAPYNITSIRQPSGPNPAFDLEVALSPAGSATPLRVGIVFTMGFKAQSGLGVYRRILSQGSLPNRIVIVCDEGNLRLGATGEESRQSAMRRLPGGITEVPLTLDEILDLQSMDQLGTEVQANRVELSLPNGETHKVAVKEFLDAQQRRDWYETTKLLKDVLKW